jgi:hypothetical protein
VGRQLSFAVTAFIVGFFQRLYLFDANGAVIRWLAQTHDNRTKKSGRKISRVSTGLEAKVEERTKDLEKKKSRNTKSGTPQNQF